jgi:short-subunit dehydrogenase
MELAGRTVLLTGASGGIGRHIAERLTQHGARVVASGRDEPRLAGAPAVARLAADLREPEAAAALVARAEAEAGPLDGLVACAGREYTGAYARQTLAEIDEIVRVNLIAPMALIAAALPGMLARRRGHVVAIASIAGVGAAPYLAVYGATKAGLIGLIRSLRVEHQGAGVGFSAVSPGFVRREGMYARMERTGHRAPWLLGTVAPEEVADEVVAAIERDRAEPYVSARPIRPFAAVAQLSARAGALGIVAAGARRFLRDVGRARGRA